MKTTVFSLLIMFTACSSTFGADIPCWEFYAELAYQGEEALSLFVLPSGTGPAFSAAPLHGGSEVDATITVTLEDCFGDPVVGFPAEDLWLESVDDGLMACPGGDAADAPTDENGVTHFLNPLMAGGSSAEGFYVVVGGWAISDFLPLMINSADFSGDGAVTLSDVGLFCSIFFGEYSYRADFHFDGVISLSDVGRMATGLGSQCQ
ncbi:MAG: hypothetical protein GY780_03080 [bacterium]|nr:hypothetical protein [bacterium]